MSIKHPARRPLDQSDRKPALLRDALNGKHIGNGFILGTYADQRAMQLFLELRRELAGRLLESHRSVSREPSATCWKRPETTSFMLGPDEKAPDYSLGGIITVRASPDRNGERVKAFGRCMCAPYGPSVSTAGAAFLPAEPNSPFRVIPAMTDRFR